MILRGMVLPSGSLRWPVSMTCEIRVLTWMISPTLAFRAASLSASAFGLSCLAAATADGDLDGPPAIRNLPSLSSAMAMTSCVPIRRMRLSALAAARWPA